jgi:hypothetical protein
MSTEYTLKKLRSLCVDIHDEQIAILLRNCLKDFPIMVINEFFTGPKLNKPSNADEREWTDLIRMVLIALSPEGSEPAKLRGIRFGRYMRVRPYDPDSNDADALGELTLRNTNHTSPLLKDIAIGLGITSLKIRSNAWLDRYLSDPFSLKELSIYIDNGDFRADFSEALDILPESLESFSLDLGGVNNFPKLNGDKITRLTLLTSLRLEVDSLPKGIDFSKNTKLESIDLEIKKGGPKPICGIAGLQNLKKLKIQSDQNIALESIAPQFKKCLEEIQISGVEYLDGEIQGQSPKSIKLGRVSGVRKIVLAANSSEKNEIEIGGYHGGLSDLETLELSGFIRNLEVKGCPKLLNLQSDIRSDIYRFKVSSCSSLNKIEAVFKAHIDHLEIEDLPALAESSFEAPSGCKGSDSSSACRFKNIGSKHLPVFKGAWKGFSKIDILDCPNLENIAGLHVLPDLLLVNLKNLQAMKSLFPTGSSPLPTLTHLHAERVYVQAPAGFEAMPSLTQLDWIDCSLDSMSGVEANKALKSADLTGSDLKSIAPFAELPLLTSIRVSKCEDIRPKPPRVLLEGDVLASELSRATGGKITTGARGEFLKVVELLSTGSGDDILQAVQFIPILTDEERRLLLTGTAIDPKTGWIRLPFLAKIKEEESRGLTQFHILLALREMEPAAAKILDSVETIVFNPRSDQTEGALCFGFNSGDFSGLKDQVLENFPSIAALPALKNVTSIQVNAVSRFSLDGISKFSTLKTLSVLGVTKIEQLGSLSGHACLNDLQLSKPNLPDLQEIGPLPALKTLYLDQEFKTLRGIENFPSLDNLQTNSIDDLSELFSFAKKSGKTLAFTGSFGGDHHTSWGVGFKLV